MTALRPDHIWFQLIGREHGWAIDRPALFVDRDGVLVQETNYLHRVEDVDLIDGVESVLALANARALPVVMVTNQAGIGRGYYGWHEFALVNEYILAQLAQRGARVDAVIACPFHEQGVGDLCHADHPMRKPNPGMLFLAGQHLGLDFARSLIIGDQASDLRAGQAAGLGCGIHVLTGHGQSRRDDAIALASTDFEVKLATSIADPLVIHALQHR